MKSEMLDLVGGSGEKPRGPAHAVEPTAKRVVIDHTPDEIAAGDDDWLIDVYGHLVEYDASGGRVTAKLHREMKRRGLLDGPPMVTTGRNAANSASLPRAKLHLVE